MRVCTHIYIYLFLSLSIHPSIHLHMSLSLYRSLSMILPEDTREELRYLSVYNEITMYGTTMNDAGSKCIIFPTHTCTRDAP